MVDRKRAELVAVACQHVAGAKLDELDWVGELPENRAERVVEVAEPGRPVDRERHVAHPQRERLEHPWQAEVVVGMEVRDEDVLEIDEADRRAQQLALRPFAAVEEHAIAAPPHEQGRGSAPRSRCAGGRSEEGDVEVHAPMVTAGSVPTGPPRYGSSSRSPGEISVPFR